MPVVRDHVRPGGCSAELEELWVRTGQRFRWVHLRRGVRACAHETLAPLIGRTSRQSAEHAGQYVPAGVQHPVAGACWGPDEVRIALQECVAEKFGDPAGVLIVDDIGLPEVGTMSSWVRRQRSGTAGRAEKRRIGIFAVYASPRGCALVDWELYLPKSGTFDPQGSAEANLPEERAFATKGDLARAIVMRALASPLPIASVTADSAYGQERQLRRTLEKAGIGYVLAVPKSQHVSTSGRRIDLVIARAPDDAWKRHPCGVGANSPHFYDWAAARLPVTDDVDGDAPTHDRWVMARRSSPRPGEIAYYLAYAPTGTAVAELVSIATSRSAVERAFQNAKHECGWISSMFAGTRAGVATSILATLGHAFLAAMAAQRSEGRWRERFRHFVPARLKDIRRLWPAGCCRRTSGAGAPVVPLKEPDGP
ncbi:IS701 family transposase [Streptomyces sp. NPDC059680]|uniref:IS701 family transposase n=1 Tax=Streptomyces sp. NPDC059680 TaxID=3346904 RepID=UPI0036C7EC50